MSLAMDAEFTIELSSQALDALDKWCETEKRGGRPISRQDALSLLVERMFKYHFSPY